MKLSNPPHFLIFHHQLHKLALYRCNSSAALDRSTLTAIRRRFWPPHSSLRHNFPAFCPGSPSSLVALQNQSHLRPQAAALEHLPLTAAMQHFLKFWRWRRAVRSKFVTWRASAPPLQPYCPFSHPRKSSAACDRTRVPRLQRWCFRSTII